MNEKKKLISLFQHLHHTPLYIAPFVSQEKYQKEKKAQGMAVRTMVSLATLASILAPR